MIAGLVAEGELLWGGGVVSKGNRVGLGEAGDEIMDGDYDSAGFIGVVARVIGLLGGYGRLLSALFFAMRLGYSGFVEESGRRCCCCVARAVCGVRLCSMGWKGDRLDGNLESAFLLFTYPSGTLMLVVCVNKHVRSRGCKYVNSPHAYRIR